MSTRLERLRERIIPAPSGCWRWVGTIDRDGYGHIGPDLAHRAMLKELGVLIEPGLTVDHLCRNRACVNPLHLDLVSQRVNNARGWSFSAVNSRKQRCPSGHRYDAENTRIDPTTGGRACRACGRAATARYKARKRGDAR